MQNNANDRAFKKAAKILGLPEDFMRKDFYVTKAIQALINIEDNYFRLIFQGGTSLSKSLPSIITRLSEDIDFRIILKSETGKMGKELLRKRLRDFRYNLIDALLANNFAVDKEQTRVFYEGRYMSVRAEFSGSSKLSYLKPHIAIDCFFGEIALEPSLIEITTLTKETLGAECDHEYFSVLCLSPDETAAEKWVALTRRVIATKEKQRQSDKHLVRHLYDLYRLRKEGLLTGEHLMVAKNTMLKDQKMFKQRNQDYSVDPVKAAEDALDMLFNDKQWRGHWGVFLEQMVYEKDTPSFLQALEELRQLSHEIFSYLKENHFNPSGTSKTIT